MFETAEQVSDFLYKKLNICGCFELDEFIETLKDFLGWIGSTDRVPYNGKEKGMFYFVIGVMDNARLCEHGISSRHPFLTTTGKELLSALYKFSSEEIESA